MSILYVGIDLAANVFAVHGVNEAGTAELRQPKVTRAKLHGLVASLPPCVIGMEACSGARVSGILCARHSMTTRSMYAKQEDDEGGGSRCGGDAVDPRGAH